MNDYIVSLIEQGKRIDGRKFDEMREAHVELNISKNAEGSAKCKIGDTEVMIGVKMDVGTPYPDSPDEGSIIVTTELSPIASPEFELGPPGIQATEIARIVDRGIRESKAIDMKKLGIVSGEKSWLLFIDVYPVNDDGNLIDASALGTLAALKNTRYVNYENGKVKFGEFTDKKLELEKTPITFTFIKIGNSILLDPNAREEKAAEARLSIAVYGGRIHALQKGGDRGFTEDEIEKMIDIAIKKEKDLKKVLDKAK